MTDLEAQYRAAAEMAVNEAIRAYALFPVNKRPFKALTEEVGELAKALMDHEEGNDSREHVYEEAIQVAAVAIRIVCEGDLWESGLTGAFSI